MNIADHQRDHEFCLAQAAELLGGPARVLCLAFNVEQLLRRNVRLEGRRGLTSEHAHLTFTGGPKGQQIEFGMELFQATIDGQAVPLVKVVAPQCSDWAPQLYDFWAVRLGHYRRLYRFIRRLERGSLEAAPPVMREVERARLWDNTIGFLRRGNDVLRRFGVAPKRGVVLLGEPGNGKTMACRWLLAQCHRHGFRWRNVTADDYEGACGRGEVRQLFELEGPGIVLFDDLDHALQDRSQSDTGTRRTTFLTELDGLYPREGVVTLFTSNSRWRDLDPAFRRPGRIDLQLQFPRPDAELRRRFVTERWHADLAASLDLDLVVRATDGLSFAEMDEVKKLIVLKFLETGTWNWDAAWAAFRDTRAAARPRIGFAAPSERGRQKLMTAACRGA